MGTLDKKILHFSEFGFTGFIPETSRNWRTEMTWTYGLKACNYCYNHYYNNMENSYDYILAIIPKTKPEVMALLLKLALKENRKYKIGIIQEGGHDYFTEWQISYQTLYINLLRKIDFILVMNDFDKAYYRNFIDENKIFKFDTPIRLDLINQIQEHVKENKVMIGGNMTEWYQGTLSLFMARKFNLSMTIPTMGRHHPDENKENVMSMFEEGNKLEINYLPYLQYDDWIRLLSRHKYAVHMMKIAGAGSFSLNCASVGIPCIGRNTVSTQLDLFPELTLNEELLNKDGKNVEEVVKLLLNENEYKRIVDYAEKQLYKYEYKNVCISILKFLENISNGTTSSN